MKKRKGRECVHACGAFVYVVCVCWRGGGGGGGGVKGLRNAVHKGAWGWVVWFTHTILVVGMWMSSSTHGDSGSMATQCMLPMWQSVRGECGRLVASPTERATAVALSQLRMCVLVGYSRLQNLSAKWWTSLVLLKVGQPWIAKRAYSAHE